MVFPRWPVLFLSALLLVGCGKVIRGAADVLGVEGNDQGGDTSPGPTPPSSSIVSLIRGSHRTVEGAGPVVVAVVRRRPTQEAVSIDFKSVELADGAQEGIDYRPVSGTLTWAAGDWEPRFVTIEVLRDQHEEDTEEFRLEFSNVQGAITDIDPVTCYIDDPGSIPLLSADVSSISAAKGGSQRLWLRAGQEFKGKSYLVAGSLGDAPGFALQGLQVPLNRDLWFELTLARANTSNLIRTSGVLNSEGQAFAELRAPAIPIPGVVGLRFFHAYVVHDGNGRFLLVSNAVPVSIVE